MAMVTKKWTVLLSGINVGQKKWTFTQIITFKKDNQSGPGDQFAYVERYEIKELLVGIMSIQQSLAKFVIRLDHQGNELDSLKRDVHGQHGIENRLQEQANDVTYDVTELSDNQRKMHREMERMRDYIIRLEQKIHKAKRSVNS